MRNLSYEREEYYYGKDYDEVADCGLSGKEG